MSVADLLNTDVGLLGRRLRAAFAWWTGELGEMAAPLLAQRRPRDGLVATRRDDGSYRLSRGGAAAGVHAGGGEPVAAALALPAAFAMVRTVAAPALPERDVRRMIALDLDRLTPLRAEALYHAAAPAPAGADGSHRWRLVAVPRTLADRAAAEADAAGIALTAVLAGGEEAKGEAALDLLPAMRTLAHGGGRPSHAARVWALVAALAAANVAAAVWRDVRLTQGLEAAVAARQPAADHVARLRRRLEAISQAARAQIAARDADEPLRTLDALTGALDDDVWARRLNLDHGALRLSGARRDGADATAMLRRSARFADVRDGGDDGADANGFDLAARVVAPADGPVR